MRSPSILLLPRHSRKGASSRLRLLQYIPALEAVGFSVSVDSLFDSNYLDAKYAGKSTLALAARATARRAWSLRTSRRFDLIWLQAELLPWLPWMIERRLVPAGVPIVADYDDAIFHTYDMHGRHLVRCILGDKIDRVMANATLVTAGNEYLATRARSAGAKRIEIVPTVVDLNSYSSRSDTARGTPRRIGWIGTPSTWTEYVEPMLPTLLDIAARHDAVVMAVGAPVGANQHPRLEVLPWSEEAESRLIGHMDVGLMPLDGSPWSNGKCGYKLIQYMACSVPVVASPVGVNTSIVDHGTNGLLADSPQEWRDALEHLLSDSSMGEAMGRAGREKVEARYSLQTHGPRLASILRGLV